MPINAPIYIVDDDPGVSDALVAGVGALGHVGVTAFASGELFLAALPALSGGCVLLDINLPGVSGWDVQQALRERGSRFAVVILTGRGDVGQAVRAMRQGAIDFLEKPFDLAALATAIDAAHAARHEQAALELGADRLRERVQLLSERERAVLSGLVDGQPNKTIAHMLGLSPRTVEIYRAKLMDKLGAKNLSETLRIAFAAGLIVRHSPG